MGASLPLVGPEAVADKSRLKERRPAYPIPFLKAEPQRNPASKQKPSMKEKPKPPSPRRSSSLPLVGPEMVADKSRFKERRPAYPICAPQAHSWMRKCSTATGIRRKSHATSAAIPARIDIRFRAALLSGDQGGRASQRFPERRRKRHVQLYRAHPAIRCRGNGGGSASTRLGRGGRRAIPAAELRRLGQPGGCFYPPQN